MTKKVILDVDTGHDDMIAIVMASGSPKLELMGIVAVMGNQVLERTLDNTLKVCELIGEHAPVYAGMDRPLVRPRVIAGDIHGVSGLDGPQFAPLARRPEELHGVRFIIETVLAHPHEITLIPTGPLTDIAMAIRLEPRLPSLVREIVLMGGSMGRGNRTPYAEFNIHADPEAAQIVLESGAPVVMMGLDVTLQVQLDEERLGRYRALGTRTSRMFADSMVNYMRACRAHGSDYPAMHDPCCVAYAVDPTIFTLEKRAVTVELHDRLTYGKTHGVPSADSNVSIGVHVDVPRFWNLLEQSFARLP